MLRNRSLKGQYGQRKHLYMNSVNLFLIPLPDHPTSINIHIHLSTCLQLIMSRPLWMRHEMKSVKIMIINERKVFGNVYFSSFCTFCKSFNLLRQVSIN